PPSPVRPLKPPIPPTSPARSKGGDASTSPAAKDTMPMRDQEQTRRDVCIEGLTPRLVQCIGRESLDERPDSGADRGVGPGRLRRTELGEPYVVLRGVRIGAGLLFDEHLSGVAACVLFGGPRRRAAERRRL